MAGHIVIPVKFFNVNDFRCNGTHLQQIERSALQGPLQVLILPEGLPHFLSKFIEPTHLVFLQKLIGAGAVAFPGNLVTAGAFLTGNQLLALPLDRFYQDGRSVVGRGREQDAGFLAVYHLLHHHVHLPPFQVEMPGIVLHTRRVKGGHASADALHQMGPVHKKEGIVLTGIGSLGPVFIGGR